MPTCAELQATLDAIPQTDLSQAKPQYALAGCVDPVEPQGLLGPVGVVGAAVLVLAVLGAAWQFHMKRKGY